MGDELYPAHIRDNPIMQGAFAGFMDWIWRQDGAHAAFCEQTGTVPLIKRTSPLDAMIDNATGYTEKYTEGFVQWAIDTQWGVEGRDDLDAAGEAARG